MIDGIDPELRAFYASQPRVDLDASNLPAVRQAIGARVAALLPRPSAPPELQSVPGSAQDRSIAVRIYRPPGARRSVPAILHLHAGGFVMGTAMMSDGANEMRAMEHDAMVISIDYRLAPEAQFPAQVEDCYAVLNWVSDNARHLGVDPGRLALFGESAGGGLAAALAILARDRGGPTLAGQFLSYPMLDCRTGARDGVQNPRSGAVGWSRASNQFGWQSMRGNKAIAERDIGYFSPALASDLSRLPPTYIAVGELDLLIDDSINFATRLIHAGVPTELHVYPGAPHGFDNVPGASIADRFKTDLRAALTRALS